MSEMNLATTIGL